MDDEAVNAVAKGAVAQRLDIGRMRQPSLCNAALD